MVLNELLNKLGSLVVGQRLAIAIRWYVKFGSRYIVETSKLLGSAYKEVATSLCLFTISFSEN